MRHRLWSHHTTTRLLQALQQRRYIQRKSEKLQLMYTDLAGPTSNGYDNWSVERLATAWTAPSVIASEHAAVQKVLQSFGVDESEGGETDSKKAEEPLEKPAAAAANKQCGAKKNESTAPVKSQPEARNKSNTGGFTVKPIEVEEEQEVKAARTTNENPNNLPSEDPIEPDSTIKAETEDEGQQSEPLSTVEVSTKKIVEPEPIATVEVSVKNIVDAVETLSGEEDNEPESRRRKKTPWWSSRKTRKEQAYGCSRDLVDLPRINDVDHDHHNELVCRKESVPLKALLPTTEYTVLKVICDFVEQSGFDKVSSRDLGRYLKRQKVGNDSFLESLKEAFGSLYHYLAADEAYILTHDEQKEDPNFWVSMSPEAQRRLVESQEESNLSNAEKQFFELYSTQPLANKELMYGRTLLQDSLTNDDVDASGLDSPPDSEELSAENRQSNSLTEYASLDKTALKDACREFGVKVSGTKVELLERIQMHLKANSPAEAEPSPAPAPPPSNASLDDYLKGLSVEYLRANGGRVGSRNMGRYLAANKGKNRGTALADLKGRYGSLFKFVSRANSEFAAQPSVGGEGFGIVLQR